MNPLLKPLPRDGRFYCGPGALGIVTGEHPKGVIRALINQRRGRPANTGIIGTHYPDLEFALTRLGFHHVRIKVEGRPTLKAWAAEHAAHPVNMGGVWIVNVTGHWVTVDARGYAADNKSKMPRPLAQFPGNRARVKGALRVWIAGTPGVADKVRARFEAAEAARKAKRKNYDGPTLATLRAAAPEGVEIRDDGEDITADAPSGFTWKSEQLHTLTAWYSNRDDRPEAIRRIERGMADGVESCDCGCGDDVETESLPCPASAVDSVSAPVEAAAMKTESNQ